jgi:hypothetical protein
VEDHQFDSGANMNRKAHSGKVGRLGCNDRGVPILLHFTATWAEPICGPHRIEVREAARTLGWTVVERDFDANADEARMYGILNVPAVAIEGDRSRPPVIGARPRAELVAELTRRP